jgi:hypothetical protein
MELEPELEAKLNSLPRTPGNLWDRLRRDQVTTYETALEYVRDSPSVAAMDSIFKYFYTYGIVGAVCSMCPMIVNLTKHDILVITEIHSTNKVMEFFHKFPDKIIQFVGAACELGKFDVMKSILETEYAKNSNFQLSAVTHGFAQAYMYGQLRCIRWLLFTYPNAVRCFINTVQSHPSRLWTVGNIDLVRMLVNYRVIIDYKFWHDYFVLSNCQNYAQLMVEMMTPPKPNK